MQTDNDELRRLLETFFLANGGPGGVGDFVWYRIWLVHEDGSTPENFPVSDAGMASAIAGVTGQDLILIPGVVTFVNDYVFPDDVSIEALGGFTDFTGQVTGGDGGYYKALNLKRTANDGNDLIAFVGPPTGTSVLERCNVQTTQTGVGNSYAIQGDDGDIVLHQTGVTGTATGGGDGYGIVEGDGQIYMDGGWLQGSTAPAIGQGAASSTPSYSESGTGKVLDIGVLGAEPAGWNTVGFDDSLWPAPIEQTGATFGAAILGTEWITHTLGHITNESYWLYRHEFALGANPLSSASLEIWADNEVKAVYINGTLVWAGFDWGDGGVHPPAQTVALPIGTFTTGANNVIAIKVQNGTAAAPNVSSLDYELTIVQVTSTPSLLTNAVRMDPVVGEVTQGDKSGWDVVNFGARHSADWDDGDSHHQPVTLAAGSSPVLTLSGQELYLGDVVTQEEFDASSGASGGGDHNFFIDGRLAVLTEVGGVYITPSQLGISGVYIYCKDKGTAGSTIIDINKNGNTIYVIQADRPTLAFNDADGWAKGALEITQLVEGDILKLDIDQVATAAESLTVIVALRGVVINDALVPDVVLDGFKPGAGTDNIALPLGAGGQWDDDKILHPCAIENGGTVYLFYSGNDGATYRIGVASEPVSGFTGVGFSKYAGNPILSEGAGGQWDDGGVMDPWVIYDAEDGLWKMWYRGISGGVGKIGYATASTPTGPWAKDGGNPVLSPDVGWEGTQVLLPSVLKEAPSNYKMLYTGNEPASVNGRIGLALSTDGISWTKYSSNPVLSPSGAGWMAASVFSPRTFLLNGGVYQLLFSGKQAGAGFSKCGYASSEILTSWTLGSNNPTLSTTRAWEGGEAENPNLIEVGDYQYVFYDCYFGAPDTIGVTIIPV